MQSPGPTSLQVLFLGLVFVAAVVSGATAALSGFGIGSILTPLLAARAGAPIAVAAVAIPHALATAVRCWRLRHAIDWRILRQFGLLSAVGGLAGALLNSRMSDRPLTLVLGALLLATAVAGLNGWPARWTPQGPIVWMLGLASGFFGGVAGNQGGLRAAALLSWGLSPSAFVATATATGLMVDAARTPVYLWNSWRELLQFATPIAVATVGVLVGTLLGERVLLGLSRERFQRLVSLFIGLLGVWLIVRGL